MPLSVEDILSPKTQYRPYSSSLFPRIPFFLFHILQHMQPSPVNTPKNETINVSGTDWNIQNRIIITIVNINMDAAQNISTLSKVLRFFLFFSSILFIFSDILRNEGKNYPHNDSRIHHNLYVHTLIMLI